MASLQTKCQSLKSSETILVKEYTCSKCKDKGGHIITKLAGETVKAKDFDGRIIDVILKHDTEQWSDCECLKIRRVNRLIKSSAITEEFQKMGFKNFNVDAASPEVKRMRDVAVQYFKNYQAIKQTRENSVVCIGQPGCGKTHVLTAVSNGLMRELQVPVLYFPFRDGMNNISADKFAQKDHIMAQMKEVDVLFIDDLFKPIGGKIDVKGWQAEIIFEVVNHRYLNKKPMLISTELALDELIYIDEALASRIFEMATDHTVQIPKNMDNNYRLRKLIN